ncbi:oxidoreductase [Nocardioides mangrovicus]|uniref:Oxidoreductase n=1 Tax=Nocardioides mangrovicus TaxID=2478913 RepID=A0A3L8NWY9_9ACTN|nr:PDR/VanB family oxidoreductase [Nocardioides mangrovicus]RLV47444.1 oxidoreductase [Nocardioides mangrovicus]
MRSTHEEVEVAVRVVDRTVAADGVVVLDLVAADGAPLPAWEPGAHVDLDLAEDLSRQYSLCGDPTRTGTWRIGVLLEPQSRGGSRFVHDKLHVGCEVLAHGPRNHFVLEPSPRYVFVAGGIGVTPIMAMAGAAERAGSQWTLLYGGRSLATMAFRNELELLGGERVEVRPQDVHGLLDLPALLAAPRPDTLVYACGPEPLLDAVEQAMTAWPDGALHIERFTPKTFDEPASTERFEVELTRSDLVLTVAADKSILETVSEAGVDVPSSCQEGTCGTCETVVVSGEPDHRDSLLSAAEQEANETMMICVSRSRCPRLVLDL